MQTHQKTKKSFNYSNISTRADSMINWAQKAALSFQVFHLFLSRKIPSFHFLLQQHLDLEDFMMIYFLMIFHCVII